MTFFKPKKCSFNITYKDGFCHFEISWPLADESQQDKVIATATELYLMVVTCIEDSCYPQVIQAIDVFANKNAQIDVASVTKNAISKLITDKTMRDGEEPVIKPSEAFRNNAQ